MEMGEKIYNLRIQKGLTLEELGNLVGVGKSTVRKWEKGMIANMKRDKIAKLAFALGTTPAYLMGWSDSENGEGNYNVYMEIEASTREEAIYQAIKGILIANGESERAATITEQEALELYELSGFKAFPVKKKQETIAAHKEGENFTPEELEKIEEYKKLLLAARPKE